MLSGAESIPALRHAGGDPAAQQPLRRPRSIRRTTTHDTDRPEGFDGPVALHAIGRDLLTDDRGEGRVTDAARIDALVDYLETRTLAISTVPPEPALDRLVGQSSYVGFRKLAEDAIPGEAFSHSVRWQLLDEYPAAVMTNGRALRAEKRQISKVTNRKPPIDLCAGWAAGGTLVAGHTDFGPPLHIGPAAPALARSDDPLGWHELPVLPRHGTRRARRLDIWQDGFVAWADCFFRDSHVDRDGIETVVHEWRLLAEIDPVERRFISVDVSAGPLPAPECPASGQSSDRLAGLRIDGLRKVVRAGFVGPSTCSHLNDSFRAMEDVGALLDRLVVR